MMNKNNVQQQPVNQRLNGLNDRYLGTALGLLIGDARCAAYEGGPLERLLWQIIGYHAGRKRYTDDSEMAIVITQHYLHHQHLNPDTLSLAFAAAYRWSRGYGPSTAYVLKKIRSGIDWQTASRMKYADGSFGNGAAMRAPMAALCLHQLGHQQRIDQLDQLSSITHPHPEALAGARLITHAVELGLQATDPHQALQQLHQAVDYPQLREKTAQISHDLMQENIPIATLIRRYGNGTSATTSCPLAVYSAFRFLDQRIDQLFDFIIQCRGDTDTIAAMAGAIWGAFNGAHQIPADLYANIEGAELMIDLAQAIYQMHDSTQSTSISF